MHRLIQGTAALLLLAGPAVAAPATPEEAQRLATLLERYVGHSEGHASVTVVPHGEAYTASFDLGRMLSSLHPLGVDVTSGEFIAELQPQADGHWRVTADGLPPIGFDASGQATSITWNSYTFDGVFDPKIETFSNATTTSSGSTGRSTGPQGTSETRVTDTGTSTMTAVAATTPGSVNIDTHASLKDVDYRLSITPANSAGGVKPAPQAVRVGIASAQTSLTLADHPSVALADLWQFLVAHPSKDALVASVAELKSRLHAVVPLASAARGDVSFNKLTADTSFGAFGLDSFSEHYTFGGAGKDAVSTTLKVAGPSLPDGLLPAWSTSLLPISVDFSQSYGPVNLTAALNMLIDDFDPAATPPLAPAQQSAVLQALTDSHASITIAPSTIATRTMALAFSGEATMTKPLPSGTANVTATGLDKTIAAIRAVAADDPNAQQAIILLMAAKGIGKAEGPDSYSWHVEAPAGGPLTINGNALPTGASPKKPRKT